MKTYTIQTAAELLSCSTDQVRQLVNAGEIIASNIGTGKRRAMWIITQQAIDEFLARRSNRPDDARQSKQHRRRKPKPTRQWV